MKLDPNNDVYPGDLGILNARKHKWAKGTKKGYGFKIASYGILAAGLVAIIKVALMTQGSGTLNDLDSSSSYVYCCPPRQADVPGSVQRISQC